MKEEMHKPIERNQFTANWLDEAKEVGFTEAQLNFLEKYYHQDLDGVLNS